jgi:hypothetical protein
MRSVGIIAESGSYIPGIRSGREMEEVGLFRKDCYEDFVPVRDLDAIDGMLILVRKCGMLV